MDINELESFKLSDAVAFHKELNPKLWEDDRLDPEVRDQLLLIAEDFVEYLGISNLKVKDVTVSGSNAAYSYTPHSDLDLHVLVDFNELPNNEVYQELFTAKKTLYNDAHDITVRDVPVELYVQDTNNPVQSLGEYSIVHDKWIRIPKKRRANFDQAATKLKYEKLGELIELALKSKDPKRVNDTIALVKRYRKSGLDKAGEFGPENLAYKAVRKQGLVQALYDLKAHLHTEKLSIDEADELDEDFTSKQQVINYFVSRGKSAAQGAAAWERGWRGAKPKQAKPYDPERYKNVRLPYIDEASDYNQYENEIEDFVQSLNPDDVGVEEIGPYHVHFEGFTDWCQQDAQDRCHLPKEDPRHLANYDDVYKEVIRDFVRREGGKQPLKVGYAGYEDYPVIYAVFDNPEPYKNPDAWNPKIDEASGYIPSAKEKNDPRFKTALTVDVRPDANKKNAAAFGWKVSRAGIPPQARADGKIAEDLMREFKTFLGEQQEEMFPGYVPSVLYHVSPISNLPSIKQHGLLPNRSRGTSGIYLAADAPHALGYVWHHEQKGAENSVILTIDVSKLNKTKLEPDDADFPDMLDDPDDWVNYNWIDSLQISGQCLYTDTIPVTAIKDIKNASSNELLGEQQEEMFPGYNEKHRQERLNAWLGKSHAMAGKKPKVLYHATTKEFDQFRVQNQGWVSGSFFGNTQVDRTGIFLAENPKFAEEFIKNNGTGPEWKENAVIIPVYLSAQYPFSLLDDSLSPMLSDEATVQEFKEHDIDLWSIYQHFYEDKRWELFDGPEGEEFVSNLKRLGYDSAVMREEAHSHGGSEMVWVAFSPSQVKAITNRGSFSPDDNRLTKESG